MKNACKIPANTSFIRNFINSIILLCVFGGTYAQQTISVQGVLREPSGRTVEDGSYNVTFSIYDAETGSTPLWTDVYGSLPVKYGVFQANLGENTPLGSLPFDATYYVGVTVEGFDEMVPRIKLGIYPYARAILGQENKFPSAGNIVLERDSIIVKQGALKLEGPNGSILFNDGTFLNTADFAGPASGLLNPSSLIINADKDGGTGGNINMQIGGVTRMEVLNNGDVGIGRDDEARGFLNLYGDGVSGGGQVRIFNGASDDDASEYWFMESTSGILRIGQISNFDRFLLNPDGSASFNGSASFAGEITTPSNFRAGDVNSQHAFLNNLGLQSQSGAVAMSTLQLNPFGGRVSVNSPIVMHTWMSGDTIQAMNGGSTSTLRLNPNGGDVTTASNFTAGGNTFVNGNAVIGNGSNHAMQLLAAADNQVGIQSVVNGVAGTLNLNPNGGDVSIGGNALTIGTSGNSILLDRNGVIQIRRSSDGSGIQLFNDNRIQGLFDGGAGDLLLQGAGGNVGIGTGSNPTARLQIEGGPSESASAGYVMNAGGVGPGTSNTGALTISIKASGWIWGEGFRATSDQRIKSKLGISSSKEDLGDLMKIEVTEYKYIDRLASGDEVHKKLIAQQVEGVLPTAVKKGIGFIPSIYKVVKELQYDEKTSLLTVNVEGHGIELNDVIKVEVNGKMDEYVVVDSSNPNSFVIKSEDPGKAIFVYGKKVNDLRSVDYEAVSMLNVSATQELAKQVEDLQKENEKLKAKLAQMETMEARLGALEALMAPSQKTQLGKK